jgi:hypothetical protein
MSIFLFYLTRLSHALDGEGEQGKKYELISNFEIWRG